MYNKQALRGQSLYSPLDMEKTPEFVQNLDNIKRDDANIVKPGFC